MRRDNYGRGVAEIPLKAGFKNHLSGNPCRTTQLDPPVGLIYSEECQTFSDARKRDAQIKRWTRAKKEAFIAGDFNKLKQLSKQNSKKKTF